MPAPLPPLCSAPPIAFDPARVRILSDEWAALARETDGAVQDFVRGAHADPLWGPVLTGIFAASPFLSDLVLAHPGVVMTTARDGAGVVLTHATATLAEPAGVPETMVRLRRAKAETALAIALADLAGLWGVEQVTAALSDFADACVRAGLSALLLRAAERGQVALADARDPERACGYTVVGLGKLGGRELNYSSDIDLFVFFDETRLPYTGPKSPQEFAVALTKDLVQVLQERKDGYVFRTDLRLRPDPGSTSIAVSRAAAQLYYESYGQNWERAAFIKARPVAGDLEMAKAFLRDLQPFIWRKSLDFYAIQDIHSIKRQIYAHKGGGHVRVAGHNIKLGRGGIREIEFFAQIQQLIWGGRFPDARRSDTLGTLDTLSRLGFVAANVRDDLKDCYRALRALEHRLQMIADEQTQTMPADDAGLARLAAVRGARDMAAFMADVERILRTVETHYAGLFEDAPSLAISGGGAASGAEGGNLVFTGTEDDPDTIATLKRIGYAEPATIAQTVRAWHHGRYRSTRSNRARQLLTEVMPALLSAFARTTQPDAAFLRFDKCLAALPAGVPLLSVFYANPDILDLVAEIMGDAPRLAEHVTRAPALLDYVLEPQFFSPLPDAAALQRDLETSLAESDTFEGALDRLRRWAHDQQFRIGVHTLRGIADPTVAAEQLTTVAEIVTRALVPRVHAEFTRQHGRVGTEEDGLAVLAYGKLASCELTPSSDLDLVLIYDAPLDAMSQGGAKSFPAAPYYIRLAQRVITAFTALTGEGLLYAVDLRLRPNGDKGPLATSLEAFAKYQTEDAWTWEHLALVRARVVHGAAALTAAVEDARARALGRARDPDILLCAVADMRALMRKEQGDKGLWDLKRQPGGLIDAEFILQYLAVRQALAATDTRPPGLIAGLVASGALAAADGDALAAAIALWSRLQFVIRLTTEGDVAPEHLPPGLKQKLAVAAGVKDDGTLERLMVETAGVVSALFEKIITDPAAKARERLPADAVIR
ncbi:MAG: bifunctional [glutamine synthetase] adenylyltransferase/[glutamine synthetase]-adenylyl-L-tyrosine phosphorylase [Rhodospirillaceae bacterium]|nr:bifunctional [glutamine synthetase] adenylyltransferase/[glutamine synthetase]-adenylyl-L-tyrosine phosphorylase [Rhodospirillaceae bacterium]